MNQEASKQIIEHAILFAAPIPLNDRTPPEFPIGLLPGVLGEMIEAVSRATETPLELPALMGLSIVAAACQKKFEIEPEPDYIEPLNLWTIVALESGNRKTAVVRHMITPLINWEIEELNAAREDIKGRESDRNNEEARLKQLRQKYAKEKVVNLDQVRNEIKQVEENLTPVPIPPRILAQDITPEQLGRVMADHGERIAIISDEGGIFDIMAGRYNNGIPNLDLFLQAHAGAPVRVDRTSREAVHLNAPALSLGLSPQPDVLKSLKCHAGFRGRGLLARFLYCLPKSNLGFRKLENVPIPAETKKLYASLIDSLLNVKLPLDEYDKPKPYRIQLTEEAHAEWKSFQEVVERQMRPGKKFEHLRDWASKLPGAAARIAGLFHCISNREPYRHKVSKGTMDKALKLAAVLSEHALITFDLMGADPTMEAAQKVWQWIEYSKNKQFTARDCFNALRGTYKRMQDINPAFDVLIERNYIFDQDQEKRPGRPSRVFIVNPSLTEGW